MTELRSRRTVRKYSGKKVTRTIVRSVVNYARYAPSAHNSQPWKFVWVGTGEKRTRLIDSMLSSWEETMVKDRRPRDLVERTKLKFGSRFSEAPVLLVCCVDHARLYYDRYTDESRRRFEGELGHHSLAAAIQNILIACSAKGLAACWYSAPLFCQEPVRSALNLPSFLEPAAMLTIGYPVSKPPPKKLRGLCEVLAEV